MGNLPSLIRKRKIHSSIFIDAPREKVWNTMLEDATYRQWTKAFNPTSRTEGDWSEGSKMLFLGTDENGKNEGGMISRIAKNDPYRYLSIEHLGIVENGIEDTTSEKAKSWAPAFENYTFTDKNGGTELRIDMDIDALNKDSFEVMWKKALKNLKELAEKN